MAFISTTGIQNPATSGNLIIDATNGGNIEFKLGDAGGTNQAIFKDSGGASIMTVDSDGNIIVEGDMQVKGTTTTFETGTQRIEDNLINLNYVASGGSPASVSAGIWIQREDLATEAEPTAGTATANHRQFIWNETDDVWAIQINASTITPIIFSSGTPSTAYAGTNPNVATRGAAVGNSGAAQVGVFDDTSFVFINAPGQVQEALRQLDAGLNGIGVTGFAAPGLTLGTSNAAGAATTAIRSDATILVFDATSPANVSTAAVVGTASTAARRDHVHAHGSIAGGTSLAASYHNARDIDVANFGSPSNYTPVIGSDSNSNFVSAEDHLRAIDTALGTAGASSYGVVNGDAASSCSAAAGGSTISITGSNGLSTAASDGAPDSLIISPTYAAPSFTLGTSAATGSANSFVRSDATIALFDATAPDIIQPDDTAAAGTAGAAARRDHTHGIVAAAPVTIGATLAEGSSTSFARADHVHTYVVVDGAQAKGGSASIGNGATTVGVTFGTAFGTACNRVVCTIENTTDPGALAIVVVITARATTGFTATLSGATNSANYDLHWVAYGT